MASSKVVPLTCHGHSRPVPHLAFSSLVNDDQYYLISACKGELTLQIPHGSTNDGAEDNNPMLRDGMTGDWIGTFIGHKGAVWQSRLSVTAAYAATASADFTAKVWDTYTGECLYTLAHDHIVRAVAFAPGEDSLFLATGGLERKLRLFDLAAISLNGSSSSSSPLTPDGIAPGKAAAPHFEIGAGAHDGAIKSIIWGPDHNIITTAADDKMIRWWDIRVNDPIAKYGLDGPLGSCELSTAPRADNNPKAILSVAAGKTAYFFSGTVPGQIISKHKTAHELASVAINPEENRFVTGSSVDTWVRVYDFVAGNELNVHKGHHGSVWSTSFAPDGKLYATGSEDGTIKLWKSCEDSYGLWR